MQEVRPSLPEKGAVLWTGWGARSGAMILVFNIFVRIFAMGGVRALRALRHCL